jgi:hypothetical protein
MKKSLILSAFIVSSFCFGQTVSVEVSPQDFLTQVLEAIKNFGGVSTMLKISSIILLIVSSMKVSFLNDLIWSKLGSFKVYAAPVLGLIAGLLGLGNAGSVTLASVLAYVAAGGGAVFLHEILDTVKLIPGIGPQYVKLIEVVELLLGGSKPQA